MGKCSPTESISSVSIATSLEIPRFLIPLCAYSLLLLKKQLLVNGIRTLGDVLAPLLSWPKLMHRYNFMIFYLKFLRIAIPFLLETLMHRSCIGFLTAIISLHSKN